MGNIPAYYDYKNLYTSSWSPSTMHTKNTSLKAYFARYLLQEALSVFEWTLPKTWDKNYFLYSLYTGGFDIILNTDKYGVIPQNGTLGGYNVFYRPKNAIITNPLLKSTFDLEIGKDCTIIYLQPDYRPITDIISYYADLLAICAETAGTNLFNSRVSYVFGAKNKAAAESFKKMFDNVASGEPAVFIDKNLLTDDGRVTWQSFSSDVKANYIAGDILSDMKKIIAMFETDIGIPNANTDKKERLIADEVNSNNISTYSKASIWLENAKQGVAETCEMFNISPEELSVDWRNANVENVFDSFGDDETGANTTGRAEIAHGDDPGNGN